MPSSAQLSLQSYPCLEAEECRKEAADINHYALDEDLLDLSSLSLRELLDHSIPSLLRLAFDKARKR